MFDGEDAGLEVVVLLMLLLLNFLQLSGSAYLLDLRRVAEK